MKIYFLNPPYKPNFVRCGRWQGVSARGGGMDYPKWLAYAAGVAGESFEVRLIDAPASKWDKENVFNDAADYKPDLIVLDSNFSSLKNDIEIAGELKQRIPEARTVLAGPPAAQFCDEIISSDSIDIVARLEYDQTIKEIADAIKEKRSLRTVKGISFKDNGTVIRTPDREYTTSEELDKIPFVSKVYKEHLNINEYFLSQSLYPQVQIFTGRGCPHQCAFCSWPVNLMGRKYRSRSVKNIADEFEYIKKNLPEVKEIFIEDDTFTIDKNLVKAFCDELKKRKLRMTWACNARATLDYDTMKAMKDAGCRLLIVGYESGSDEILKKIKKGVDTKQTTSFTKEAKKAGLLVHGDFIIGLPGETKQTAQQTIDFIKKIKPNILQVAIATPIPGTDFHKWAKENNYLLVDDLEESIDQNGFQKCIISYPEFTKQDIEKHVLEIKPENIQLNYINNFTSNIKEVNMLVEDRNAIAGILERTYRRKIG